MRTTEFNTLSLHDALPICRRSPGSRKRAAMWASCAATPTSRRSAGSTPRPATSSTRSEEHTSELQSHSDLVCRLLLEKKKKEITDYQQNESTAHPQNIIQD